MNKEQLETNKAALKLLLNETNDKRTDYEAQITQIEKDLKDLGKIALPPMVFDDIYEAVERSVSEFDFSDTDNFDKEFGIDYDGRVHLENFDFTNTTDLIEMIVEEVSKIFTEAELKNPDTDILKRYFLCDKVLRKQGLLYFCRIIKDIEYEEINI